MHEEDADADRGDGHEHHPRQMGLHPVHGKERPTRGSLRWSQTRFIGDVVNTIEAGRRQQGWRRISGGATLTSKRKTRILVSGKPKRRSAKQQREEHVKVEAHPAELKP